MKCNQFNADCNKKINVNGMVTSINGIAQNSYFTIQYHTNVRTKSMLNDENE